MVIVEIRSLDAARAGHVNFVVRYPISEQVALVASSGSTQDNPVYSTVVVGHLLSRFSRLRCTWSLAY